MQHSIGLRQWLAAAGHNPAEVLNYFIIAYTSVVIVVAASHLLPMMIDFWNRRKRWLERLTTPPRDDRQEFVQKVVRLRFVEKLKVQEIVQKTGVHEDEIRNILKDFLAGSDD